MWLLLRVTPPQPRRIDFPPLKLVADLLPQRETPARTPLVAADPAPAHRRRADPGGGRAGLEPGRLGAGAGARRSSSDRQRLRRRARLARRACGSPSSASRARPATGGRVVALLATAEPAGELRGARPGRRPRAAARRRAAAPSRPTGPRTCPRSSASSTAAPGAEIVWISDGVAGADGPASPRASALAPRQGRGAHHPQGRPAAGAGARRRRERRRAARPRTSCAPSRTGATPASCARSTRRACRSPSTHFAFAAGATETEGALRPADRAPQQHRPPRDRRRALGRRRDAGGRARQAPPGRPRLRRHQRSGPAAAGADLLPRRARSRPSPTCRSRAAPRATPIGQLLDNQVSVLVLADVGALDEQTLARVDGVRRAGGLLLRFAGPRLAAGNDALVPVRLRRGGRTLGGTLSWDSPKTLRAVRAREPLRRPGAAGRYRRAPPDPGRARRRPAGQTWASLQDGTPIVTAEKRGEGLVVLFHVTADTTWSNLPLSGLFVDMLRRVVGLAGSSRGAGGRGRPAPGRRDPRAAPDPRRLRRVRQPARRAPPRSRPITATGRRTTIRRASTGRPTAASPSTRWSTDDRLGALDLASLAGARVGSLAGAETLDLRALLFALALMLLIARHAGLALARRLPRRPPAAARRLGSGGARALALARRSPPRAAPAPRPGGRPPPISRDGFESALVTRLAYVITGDAAGRRGQPGRAARPDPDARQPHRARARRAGRDRPGQATSSPSTRCSTGRSSPAGRCRPTPRSGASTPS